MTAIDRADAGRRADRAPRQRLVVVGNGMAGARVVEEILARGGGEQFDVTMFGDEPHGNYSRISLSNVLAGSQDPTAITINDRRRLRLPHDRRHRRHARVGARAQ